MPNPRFPAVSFATGGADAVAGAGVGVADAGAGAGAGAGADAGAPQLSCEKSKSFFPSYNIIMAMRWI